MKVKSLFFLFLFLDLKIVAQENLLSLLNEKNETKYASYIFKGTKIVNGQSVEITSKNELKFNIQHRFGPINSGFYNGRCQHLICYEEIWSKAKVDLYPKWCKPAL